MVWRSKNLIVLFFVISIFFIGLVKSYEVLDFNFSISKQQSGFHRSLCYSSLIPSTVKISSVLVKEILPKDIYVDAYEVAGNDGINMGTLLSWRSRNQNLKILIKDFIDCEIPVYLASSHEVELCSILKTGVHEICIPIHFRYQVPHSCKLYSDSVVVDMKIPTIKVKNIDDDSYFASLNCFDATGSVVYYGNPVVQSPSFNIPVGCIEDFYSVLFLSAVTISLSAVYLSLSILKTNEIFSSNII